MTSQNGSVVGFLVETPTGYRFTQRSSVEIAAACRPAPSPPASSRLPPPTARDRLAEHGCAAIQVDRLFLAGRRANRPMVFARRQDERAPLPEFAIRMARHRLDSADATGERLVRHGLRTLIKRERPGMLELLGFAVAVLDLDGPNSPLRSHRSAGSAGSPLRRAAQLVPGRGSRSTACGPPQGRRSPDREDIQTHHPHSRTGRADRSDTRANGAGSGSRSPCSDSTSTCREPMRPPRTASEAACCAPCKACPRADT